MKKIIAITLLMAFHFAHSQESQTLTWQGHAAVGGYTPEGTLEILEASAETLEDNLISLSVIVDMRTLDQENTQLRDHLRNEDFFYVEKFPVATFILSEAVPLNNSSVLLKGVMTIRGKSNEENIEAKLNMKGDKIQISFDHTMDRIRYGITYNSPTVFEKLKENAIADNFVLGGTINAQVKNFGQ